LFRLGSFESLAIEWWAVGVRFARQREAAYTVNKGAVYERAMPSFAETKGLKGGVSVGRLGVSVKGILPFLGSLVLQWWKAPWLFEGYGTSRCGN
jgi:hypothetical protein